MIEGLVESLVSFMKEAIAFLPMQLLNMLPDINISIPNDIFNMLDTIMYGVGYIVPIKALMPIWYISLSILTFSLTWSIVLRIKSFIPTMGH